ncbi:DUF4386 domain-containing protein [Subsaximicrobium wynnwilliamsii]|uniref:DUF4386 domain-containing protein n=1 Tax=Subsaximicrobium wynnwilliamsii TaxID=291179 RepID=A0A5C6ZIY4_9FLAO|nr:DUF4386 domain-containing protein [Subsaximicrobium wynnwilliamsii]TXD84526.1 DUF4386 domain-containing protein [Subsaximicrobium wynnwilliamsii]TXD90208.1 DUF4386 domain-containing protein [Subsaximicrobium wynnwilliamsii]TXE04259.1 DUF4386 domain-containing protein [Subsaximicrobium wynnwilliamsii]
MEEISRNKKARLAGILYLLLVISGFIYLVYIPLELIDLNNAAKTLENIQSSELLFRLGIVTAICSSLIFMLLPLALYSLLKSVNKVSAKFMVLFALISIPISFINILNKFSVLTLINKSEYAEKLGQTELQTQVILYLENYNNGVQLSQVFWGLWLLPFGYLVYKSGFLPKILGIFLMAGCFGYLITFFGGFLYPDFNKTIVSDIVGFPAPIGEIGICLWLLIMGTNKLNIRRKPLIDNR